MEARTILGAAVWGADEDTFESIVADIRRNRHYHPIQVVPYGVGPVGPAPGKYVIWKYEPQK